MSKLFAGLFKVLREWVTSTGHREKILTSYVVPEKSSRLLQDADPVLVEAFHKIRNRYTTTHPGYTLILTQTYRSIVDQKKEYAKGRTKKGKKVTWVDGVKKKGKHNYYPSKAIDVAVKNIVTRKVTWNVRKYKCLVKLVEIVGKEMGVKITSGGIWPKKKRDYPHIEKN